MTQAVSSFPQPDLRLAEQVQRLVVAGARSIPGASAVLVSPDGFDVAILVAQRTEAIADLGADLVLSIQGKVAPGGFPDITGGVIDRGLGHFATYTRIDLP